MYSMKKLKDIAINQMRMAASLYDVCELLEYDMVKNNEFYNLIALKTSRTRREEELKAFGLSMCEEEKKTWNDIIGEIT